MNLYIISVLVVTIVLTIGLIYCAKNEMNYTDTIFNKYRREVDILLDISHGEQKDEEEKVCEISIESDTKQNSCSQIDNNEKLRRKLWRKISEHKFWMRYGIFWIIVIVISILYELKVFH